MKIIIASDSFKGSLSSQKIIEIVKDIVNKVFPDCETVGIPIADGGEGTINAIVSSTNGRIKTVPAMNPFMNEILAHYGIIFDSTAIIETAVASGLTLIPKEKLNPLETSSYGTGQLIKTALDDGFRNIIIGLGGSATNDGGIGALSALGVRFYDKSGNLLEGKGCNLEKIFKIDTEQLDPKIKESTFTVMCDVDNPLFGERGATYVFAPQKGATEDMLKILEGGMINYASVLESKFNIDINSIKGGGAAGGLGIAFKLFLNASMKSGIDTLIDTVKFDSFAKDADLVITGEGKIDEQSLGGKAVSGIAKHCKKLGIPVLVIAGSIGKGTDTLFEMGVHSIMPIIDSCMDIEYAMENAEELYRNAAKRALLMIKLGKNLK